MRELKPKLAQRAARSAALRYKLAGGSVAFGAYAIFVPALSLMLDPQSQNPWVFLAVTILSSALLVWAYYAATGMLARRRVLD